MERSDNNDRLDAGKGSDEDRIADAKKALTRCKAAENHNRETFKADVEFSLLGEQWDDEISRQRVEQNRPCLTINRLGPIIKQVVNDSRQNKPGIKVRAVDDQGDPDTADLIAGLIRNIETTSNADVAYDTAVQNAVSGGFGYIRVSMDYAYDDAFDMDLAIERVLNPLSVYGDPNSTSVDGSDWDECFITDRLPKAQFKKKYGSDKNVNSDLDGVEWEECDDDWINDDGVLIAEWWQRTETEEDIFQIERQDGSKITVRQDQLEDPDIAIQLEAGAIRIVNTRKAKVHKVKQTIMTGVEILETNEWPGKYIPIVPVYGEEFSVAGKRYFQGLIHQAKDSQRQFNFWRSTATELAGMAPRVPFIGEQGAFDSDPRWSTANTGNHAFLEYDEGKSPPIRQPLDSGIAAGSMQEAMVATDDIKAITGIYDASLGARSNETSGKAIMARQREGDTSTFHFIDNLSRSIRQVGRILIDLIPYVYNTPRIVRVMGEDGKEEHQKINAQTEKRDKKGEPEKDEMGQVIMRLHDMSRGKYDIAVDTGPSYTTRREEAAEQLTQVIQAIPDSGPILADILAKVSDWPHADEIAERFESINPTKQKDAIPDEVKQKMQQGMEMIKQLQAENEKLKTDGQVSQIEAQADMAQAKADIAEAQAKMMEAQVKVLELQQGVPLQSTAQPQPY